MSAKTLYIVRHAKSSWAVSGMNDFDRPLNERGNKDSIDMVSRLQKRKIAIDCFVSSTALRARQTCEHFCKAYGFDKEKIIFLDQLYHAMENTIKSVLKTIHNSCNHVALFAHNPGITDFVNTLTETVHVDNMPTCGIFAVESEAATWEEFISAEKKFLFFDYPKLA